MKSGFLIQDYFVIFCQLKRELGRDNSPEKTFSVSQSATS